jgi:ethanolamine utilization protein EutN
MIIAKVMGTAVASAKLEALRSTKLLLVCSADASGNISGDPFLAVDLVGSGEGELVMISQGSSARLATGHKDFPVDAVVIGIIDSLRYENNLSYRKE